MQDVVEDEARIDKLLSRYERRLQRLKYVKNKEKKKIAQRYTKIAIKDIKKLKKFP